MSDNIKQLEEQLKKKAKKNIFETLWDILNLWYKEFKKTFTNILNIPSNWKNQISKKLEKFENQIIKQRKNI